jgi:N-6 DNA Methylase
VADGTDKTRGPRTSIRLAPLETAGGDLAQACPDVMLKELLMDGGCRGLGPAPLASIEGSPGVFHPKRAVASPRPLVWPQTDVTGQPASVNAKGIDVAVRTYEERLGLLRDVLAACGYSDRLIADDFQVWVTRSIKIAPDLVAFARSDQRDMTTSAILATVSDSEDEIRSRWLGAATALAAPAALIALPESFSLWQVGPTLERSKELDRSPLDTYESIIDRLAGITPDAVRRWKQGSIQTPLFPVDVDLLSSTRTRARNELTDYVENAILQARESSPGESTKHYSRLVIAALAVLLVRDKLRPDVSGAAVIDVAQQRFPGYFSWLNRLDPRSTRLLEDLVATLGSDLNFASLEPAMISDVYEQALLSVAARRSQGSYYSPPALAQRLLDAIPIESIPPPERYVLDPACGSGTLLLAAAARLEQLQPFGESVAQKHEYVVSHLRGYDKDPFAVEIAKLSLLMTALPLGNSWRVEGPDVLDVELSVDDQPSIIVSNPPWSYSRQDGKRVERANQFLEWMITNVRPGGFIGCILPVSWLNAQTSRRHRRLLNERCELLEVWQLPESTFSSQGSSSAAPAVIIARRRLRDLQADSEFSNAALVRRIGTGEGQLDKFLREGDATSSVLVEHSIDGDGLLDGPLTSSLRKNQSLTPLGQVALVRSGCAHKPDRPTRSWEDATHQELSSASSLEQFGMVHEVDLSPVRYPDDFHRVGQSDAVVNCKKILVSAKRSTESAYRIKVGLDLIGVVPRETFYMVVPYADRGPWTDVPYPDRLYALSAILGSGLASSWVAEREPRRNIASGVYRDLPLPTDKLAIHRLNEIGRHASEAVEHRDLSALEAIATKLEAVVAQVYQLDEVARAVIASNLLNRPAPEGVVRYLTREPADSNNMGRKFSSHGMVLDSRGDGVLLWVSGLTSDDGQWLPIPTKAPSWISRPGTDFSVVSDSGDLASASYFLHVSDWVAGDTPSPEIFTGEIA